MEDASNYYDCIFSIIRVASFLFLCSFYVLVIMSVFCAIVCAPTPLKEPFVVVVNGMPVCVCPPQAALGPCHLNERWRGSREILSWYSFPSMRSFGLPRHPCACLSSSAQLASTEIELNSSCSWLQKVSDLLCDASSVLFTPPVVCVCMLHSEDDDTAGARSQQGANVYGFIAASLACVP